MYKDYDHEIKRENGDKIFINIRFSDYTNNFRITSIGLLPKRKRNIQYITHGDDYEYRILDTAGRNKYTVKKYLEFVSVEEIKEAMLKAWESVKPIVESEEDICNMI